MENKISKYKGIDSRKIKCCDQSKTTIEAGISFDNDEGQNILRFHFLEYIKYGKNGKLEKPILDQKTKSMWLNKENTKQLIKALKELVPKVDCQVWTEDSYQEALEILREVRTKDIETYVNGEAPLLPQNLRKRIHDFLSSNGLRTGCSYALRP